MIHALTCPFHPVNATKTYNLADENALLRTALSQAQRERDEANAEREKCRRWLNRALAEREEVKPMSNNEAKKDDNAASVPAVGCETPCYATVCFNFECPNSDRSESGCRVHSSHAVDLCQGFIGGKANIIWSGIAGDMKSGSYAEKAVKQFAHTVALEKGENSTRDFHVVIFEA